MSISRDELAGEVGSDPRLRRLSETSRRLGTADDPPDLTYCYHALDALGLLERNNYDRNQLKREFQHDLERRRNRFAALLALVLPALMWIFVASRGFNILHAGLTTGQAGGSVARIFGLLLSTTMLFAVAYLAIRTLWNTALLAGLRRRAQQQTLAMFQQRRVALNQNAEQILSAEEISGIRIPPRFLSVPALILLVRYFRSGQATTLAEAISLLEDDLHRENTDAHAIPQSTPVAKERRYLDQFWANPGELVNV